MPKSPSLRRIQADVRELALDPSDQYHAAPLEDDMFEWHFTIRGAVGTDFEGGVYHGRILLPPEYPFKPPHILFLTPSGRFETGKKICLSFSAFHPELWQPAWGIRLILEALIAFLPTPADGAIGALDWTPSERKRMAKKSVLFCCPRCGNSAELLPKLKVDGEKAQKPSRFQKEIEQLQQAQAAAEAKKEETNSKTQNDDAGASRQKSEEEAYSAAEIVNVIDDQREKYNEAVVPMPEEVVEEKVDLVIPEADTPDIRVDANSPEENTSDGNAVEYDTEQNNYPHELDVSWLTDPMLNLSIILLSGICILLFGKVYSLSEELYSLTDYMHT
eukprot:CAMPEP_0194200214 /NCGR_PEP_ID=MMETSP0156-20130528/920_1 /TAXON_ID=33649 /ORGANISM="Thalassionema nitzschioides, Strain L26-B" /LENGTH=331 /DNA_ID=CAMNT_0038925187 /DNA_START=11 /DNA_END=1006 /DNA_ORIENTATION=+